MNSNNSISNFFKEAYNDIDHDHNHNHNDDDNIKDLLSNVLNLKLHKPKHWKWELTTSKSSLTIALPRILLYDHKGRLLADARPNAIGERIYGSEDILDKSLNSKHSIDRLELEQSLRKSNGRSQNAIKLNSYELPNEIKAHSRTSYSSRSVPVPNISSPTVTRSANDNTTKSKSCSSGGKRKRYHWRSCTSRRSSSLLSPSILERWSMQKGSFSSAESDGDDDINSGTDNTIDAYCMQNQRYFLRTSRVGTLIVQADSFQLHPHRRHRQYKM